MTAVEALRCGSCGAHVPVPETDSTTCAHCGASVVVPEGLRTLRRLERDHEAARVHAEAVLAALDRPASLPTRLLAALTDLPVFAFMMVYGIPLGLFAVLAPYFVLGRYLPIDDMQYGATIVSTVGVILVFFATFLPRALGVYAARRATARASLLHGLAAKPPETPGGPSRCRNCGADLLIVPGAKVSHCIYCLSDNVLRISNEHSRRTSSATATLTRTIDDARETDRAERSETRARLLRELGRYVLGLVLVGGGFVAFMWDMERVGPDGEPSLGLGAMFVSVICLIVLVTWSVLAPSKRTEEERRYEGPLGAVRILFPVMMWGGCCVYGLIASW